MEMIDYQDSVFKKQDKYAERVTTPKLEPQAPPPINSKKAEEPAAAADEKAADVPKASATSESGEKKALAKEPLTASKAKAPEAEKSKSKDVKKSKKAKKAAKKPAAKKTDDDEATAADEKAFFEEEKELQSMQNDTQSRVDQFVKQQREAYEQKMEAALASYRTNVAKIEESFIKEEEEAAEKHKGFLKSRKKSNTPNRSLPRKLTRSPLRRRRQRSTWPRATRPNL